MEFANETYRKYRKWLDAAEAKMRIELPGWNVEIREHRKGTFEMYLGAPANFKKGDKTFYITEEDIDTIINSPRVDFDEMFATGVWENHFGKSPLGV